jgi:hypothetical protein
VKATQPYSYFSYRDSDIVIFNTSFQKKTVAIAAAAITFLALSLAEVKYGYFLGMILSLIPFVNPLITIVAVAAVVLCAAFCLYWMMNKRNPSNATQHLSPTTSITSLTSSLPTSTITITALTPQQKYEQARDRKRIAQENSNVRWMAWMQFQMGSKLSEAENKLSSQYTDYQAAQKEVENADTALRIATKEYEASQREQQLKQMEELTKQ